MTTIIPTVWSVPIRLDQVGKGTGRRLVADEAQRAVLADQLELDSLDLLEAEVEVLPWGRDYEIKGTFKAAVVQTCGVTLEPLPSLIEGRFSVKASETPPVEEHDPDMEIGLETPDPPDLIENGQIDLAAYVIEHLALEIDPFPRKPGVEFEPPVTAPEPSPFAVLAQLRRDKDGD
jgi:uncharacterized metal-binding protein YceD (DUF177 family)